MFTRVLFLKNRPHGGLWGFGRLCHNEPVTTLCCANGEPGNVLIRGARASRSPSSASRRRHPISRKTHDSSVFHTPNPVGETPTEATGTVALPESGHYRKPRKCVSPEHRDSGALCRAVTRLRKTSGSFGRSIWGSTESHRAKNTANTLT